MLIWPESVPAPDSEMFAYAGPKGPLANFLRDFGPALLEKYKPKAIVVFSAHWETGRERVGSSVTVWRAFQFS
jgi:aromatic ring-opening dioxygenase catalytic subunit (LigB family)